MPRSRPAYPLEFRQKLIELVHAGRSPEALAGGLAMAKAPLPRYAQAQTVSFSAPLA